MIFRETALAGAYLIDPERHHDDRGFFVRTWCRATFAERGLVSEIDQCSVSFNHDAGTLRGLHFQRAPHAETKVVSCLRGGVYDVIVDLRPKSATFAGIFATELTAESGRSIYIPAGFAHGFQTFERRSEVSYAISTGYVAESATGIRYDDPALAIRWPLPVAQISIRDRNLPLLAEQFGSTEKLRQPAQP
jgi:dTDP-4-dehydrorhamnose 3,5-epimerase